MPGRPIDRRSFLAGAGLVGVGILGGSFTTGCSSDSKTSTATARDLRSVIRGRVLMPGDPDFARAGQPWNLAVHQQVRAVAEVADAADVAALVAYAADAGVAVSAQPNGHGAASDLNGVILVRTAQLNELHVDPAAQSVRAGAGVNWGQVLAAAGPHGLTGMAGSSGAINVTGLTLGGGLSWFGRRYGWASDSVTAFDIVDPSGRPGKVTAQSDPDLFWAMRGGGGDFALVTAVEFGLHPAPVLFGGKMVWPAVHAPAVMAAFREATAHAPDELTVWLQQVQIPGSPAVTIIAATYLGDEKTGRALLAPFDRIGGRVADTRAVMPVANLSAIMDEPTNPSPSVTRCDVLTDLDDNSARVLTEPANPLALLQIRHLGGAFAKSSNSAAGSLDARYCVIATGIVAGPVTLDALNARYQRLTTELGAAVAARKPFTFLGPGDTAAQAFAPDNLARLRDIKRRTDPKSVIRSNFPVLA